MECRHDRWGSPHTTRNDDETVTIHWPEVKPPEVIVSAALLDEWVDLFNRYVAPALVAERVRH